MNYREKIIELMTEKQVRKIELAKVLGVNRSTVTRNLRVEMNDKPERFRKYLMAIDEVVEGRKEA